MLSRLRIDDFVADGEADHFAEAGEVHFAHDVIAVAFDGSRRNAQNTGGFLVALPLCEQGDHVNFPLRERHRA